jgi:crossover junction endodeoxyribonuclease RusA
MELHLPWPHKDLSPNARVHWARKAKAVRTSRSIAFYDTVRARRIKDMVAAAKGLSVYYVFYPADNRRRDLDNLIASTKAYTDGIAQALGVDDSTFKLGYRMGAPCKPACVVVTIE